MAENGGWIGYNSHSLVTYHNGTIQPEVTTEVHNIYIHRDNCEIVANGTDVHDIFEIAAVRYALVACYILAIILAASGNGYLMYYIIRHRKRTRTNVTALLIFNLAFCDFILTILTPLRLADILMVKVPGDADLYCKTGSFFSLLLACSAFLSIVAIGYERLLLICFPLKSKSWLTIQNTRKVIIGVWAVSFITALPMPILYTFIITIPLSNKVFTFCLVNVFQAKDEPCMVDGRGYFLFLFIGYYLLPVVVLTVCYSQIFYTLYCGASLMKDTTDEKQKRMLQTRKSLAKMMLFIAISFTLLEGPYFITFLLLSIGVPIRNNAVFLLMVVEFLPMVSAIINPLVYSVRTRTFKKSVSNVSTIGQGEPLMRHSTRRNNLNEQPYCRQSQHDRFPTNNMELTRSEAQNGNGHNANQTDYRHMEHVLVNGIPESVMVGTAV